MSLFTPGSLLSRVEALEALKEGLRDEHCCDKATNGVVFTPGSLLAGERGFLKGGTEVKVREEGVGGREEDGVVESRESVGEGCIAVKGKESGKSKGRSGVWREWRARFGRREGWVRWDEGRFRG